MRKMRRLYHFLGGIRFAVILLALAMSTVIGGTILESRHDSHLLAAQYTYNHPLFQVLLGMFFVNILFAATRRWPFKQRHIPFLITHLGLLMLLGGAMAKGIWGVQGSLAITEGSGSHTLIMPGTHALRLTYPNETSVDYPIQKRFGQFNPRIVDDANLKVDLVAFYPHSKESWHTWIVGDTAHIAGLPPFPVRQLDDQPIPIGMQAQIEGSPIACWNFIALTADSHEQAIQAIYCQQSNAEKLELPAARHQDAVACMGQQRYPRSWDRSLTDTACPINAAPTVVLSQIEEGTTMLWAFDQYGYLWSQEFTDDDLDTLAVFDHGFGGYGAYAQLPFPSCDYSPRAIHSHRLQQLQHALKDAFAAAPALSPPLEALRTACNGTPMDPAAAFVELLDLFSQCPENIYDPSRTLSQPIQLSQLAVDPDALNQTLHHLSTWFLEYNLTLEELSPAHLPIESLLTESTTYPELESPVVRSLAPLEPVAKIEDNQPAIVVRVEHEGREQQIGLSYDPYCAGISWPLLNGRFKARFLPRCQDLPFHIRLHSAEKITYPHSNQPFSYEADLWVSSRTQQAPPIAASLSMNHVYETAEGYRVYLSNIAPGTPGEVQQVQLAVNHDPAKYHLTYPGGILVGVGIIMLFWLQPYRRTRH